MRLMIVLFTLFVAALVMLPFTQARAGALALPAPAQEVDGYLIDGLFLDYYLAHGGLERFGAPLSDEVIDTALGVPVQYFTYARMERHGDKVLLTRIGSLLAATRQGEQPFQWLAAEGPFPPERTFVPESGHTIGGAFGWYFAQQNSWGFLGFPISEEFYEPQPDGSTLLVQYFERTRLSYHTAPDGSAGEVRQMPAGAWLAEQVWSGQRPAGGGPLVPLATTTIAYRPASESGRNIEVAAARLNGTVVEPGHELSFLGAVGEVTAAAGFVPGAAVRNGEIVYDEIGGGICTVSTLLYQAAWSAGLPIEERRGHSRWLVAFADKPGLDAAVVAPGQDLRVLNDTGSRMYVVAAAAAGQATVTLWGRSDGRQTQLVKPEMSDGEQIEVVNARVVKSAAGAVLRRDRVVTIYQRPASQDDDPDELEEPEARPFTAY
jgi:hypothetical protein